MTYRIVLSLDCPVMDALRTAAIKELRSPKEQARYLLQQVLLRSGLLAEKVNTGVNGLGNLDTGVTGANT
jgi:hypothetical protein